MPEGSELVVMLTGGGGAGATVSAKVLPAVWDGEDESVTSAVKEKLPLCVGVPEMLPAFESVSPGASDPEERFHA